MFSFKMDDRNLTENSEKKCSWKQFNKTEKCLFVVVSFSVLAIILLASSALTTKQQNVCLTEKCIRSAAFILSNMDKTINPCDDFYQFACGSFVKNAIIPVDEASVSSVSGTSEKITRQLKVLFEEPYQHNEPYFIKLVKTVYNSCMNTTNFGQGALDLVKGEFKNLGGWPVVEPNWNENKFDWEELVDGLKTIGFRRNFFFRMSIDVDYQNSSKYILTIKQPSEDYATLMKGINDTSVQGIYNLLVEVAVLFGAERATAASDMKDVIDFEVDLANLIIMSEDENNTSLYYYTLTIEELQLNCSSVSWLRLFNNYLFPVDIVTSNESVNVMDPEFFEKFTIFLPKIKKRTLANFMFSRIVRDLLDYLPEEFTRNEEEFLKIFIGNVQVTPRWKTCVKEASRLHVAVSYMQIKYLFDHSTKQKVTQLLANIKETFLDTLKNVGWMDWKTKRHAIIKAKKMSSYVAYPDELLNDKNVEDYYQGLKLNPKEDYLKIHFNLSKFSHMKHVQILRKRVKKSYWVNRARTYNVGAFYMLNENSIRLPAAVLQDFFFDGDRPHYLNYGTIAQIIGHEITHGFDNDGRNYDKDGNVIDWWDPKTSRIFDEKSECLVNQYSNYSASEINGVKTLGENIADNGGIKTAYKSYLKWSKRNKLEPSLPGLPYTPRQLFWISAAHIWCTKYKNKEVIKHLAIFDEHSPKHLRVVVPLMNSGYFASDFNCPLGSPMNPKNKCQVW